MEEKAFFLIFAGVILAVLITGIQGGFSEVATSTPTGTSNARTSNTLDTPRYGGNTTNLSNTTFENKTNVEIQAELEDLYDELWELEQKVDSALRREPISRYADIVRLSRSSATSQDPDREYLTLTLDRDAKPTNISDWYLESYVTEKRMAIPDGTKIYIDGGVINKTAPIILEPGERAYLITGESPVNTSFQENSCIGYLRESKDFYPGISYNCPRPTELMDRYANIDLDDDSCYDFVESVYSCRAIEEDDRRLNELSGKCRNFIRDYLNYNSCVDTFSWRTDFHENDDWYVYFERDEERWRREREIIRLMDEYDEVIAVIEY